MAQTFIPPRRRGSYTLRRPKLQLVTWLGASPWGSRAFVIIGITALCWTACTWGAPNTEAQHRRLQQQLLSDDYVGASRTLQALTARGALQADDAQQLAAAVRAGRERMLRDLRVELGEHLARRSWDLALATLEQMRHGELGGDWPLFAEAEVLRAAGRIAPAREAYARYIAQCPQGAHLAPALYNYAQLLRRQGRLADARRVFERVVHDYPQDRLAADARRGLGEIGGAAL